MPEKKSFQCHCGDHIPENLRGGIRMRVCRNFLHYADFEGKPFCILHYPGKEKAKEFRTEIRKKEMDGYDYRGIWFPEMANYSHTDLKGEVHFQYATFTDIANFDSTTFDCSVKFQEAIFLDEARFNQAKFPFGVYFNSAKFWSQVSFYYAEFTGGAFFDSAAFYRETAFDGSEFTGPAFFRSVTFSDLVSFDSAGFSDDAYFNLIFFDEKSQVSFNQTCFQKTANFSAAIIKGYLRFEAGDREFTDKKSHNKVTKFTPVFEGDLSLKHARIAKPEQILFDKVRLSPAWFVDTDSRKFTFCDVNWESIKRDDADGIASKIEYLKTNHKNAHKLLAIACRQLAVNAEENSRYDEASDFRFMAMESQRLEYSQKFAPWKLHWWYWFSSGYGEIWRRALLVLFGIWLLFAVLYFSPLGSFKRDSKSAENQQTAKAENEPATRTENQPAAPPKIESLAFGESLLYSLNVMTLQKPEPAPAGLLTRALVTLETILGPLQAALLALAIRRKFMR